MARNRHEVIEQIWRAMSLLCKFSVQQILSFLIKLTHSVDHSLRAQKSGVQSCRQILLLDLIGESYGLIDKQTCPQVKHYISLPL